MELAINGKTINLPSYQHHMTIRKILTDKVEEGAITEDEADQLYQEWKDKRKED